MDILVRIIIMIGCSIFIPYIGNLLYSRLSEINFKELTKQEKIDMIPTRFLLLFYSNASNILSIFFNIKKLKMRANLQLSFFHLYIYLV